MKTLNEYTIYCTEEQTRKALELSAPIRYASVKEIGLKRFIEYSDEFYALPTAEQMIGWLEEQGLHIDTEWSWDGQVTIWVWYNPEKEHIYTSKANSRQVATLAAIDAALEYLFKNKN